MSSDNEYTIKSVYDEKCININDNITKNKIKYDRDYRRRNITPPKYSKPRKLDFESKIINSNLENTSIPDNSIINKITIFILIVIFYIVLFYFLKLVLNRDEKINVIDGTRNLSLEFELESLLN